LKVLQITEKSKQNCKNWIDELTKFRKTLIQLKLEKGIYKLKKKAIKDKFTAWNIKDETELATKAQDEEPKPVIEEKKVP
jgi:hypothetical protein